VTWLLNLSSPQFLNYVPGAPTAGA